MSECLGCLDCQVMYNDNQKCPPLVSLAKSKVNNRTIIKVLLAKDIS